MRSPICSIKYTDTLGSFTIIQSYIDYNAMFFFINNTNASVRYFSLYKQCVKQADHIMIQFHHFLLLFSFSLSFCYRKYDAHRFTTEVLFLNRSMANAYIKRISENLVLRKLHTTLNELTSHEEHDDVCTQRYSIIIVL